LSSAILYLAIVAIWAGVLIPRWLRNDAGQQRAQTRPQPVDSAGGSHESVPGDLTADPGHDHAPDAGPRSATAGSDRASDGHPSPMPGASAQGRTSAAPSAARVSSASPVPNVPAVPGGPAANQEERRARVLSARRRLLAMLLVLVAGAALIAAAKLAAWWVVVPPATMLAGYLRLLREAANADAERDLADHAVAMRARRARLDAKMAAYERAAAGRPEVRGQPTVSRPDAAGPRATRRTAPPRPGAAQQAAASAEVLDISGRVAEEPYDQYTDAGLRAVGD
jgi:hypothetical protein